MKQRQKMEGGNLSLLDQACKKLNKDFNKDIISQGLHYENLSKIPFTSPRLNYMTYGGLPKGRIIEFFGEEGGGKTTTALDIVKNAQILFKKEAEETGTAEKKVVYVDCENTLDAEWAELLGVDLESLYIVQPDEQYAEDIFDAIIAMVETEEVGLVVIDSLPAMMSKQEFEKSVEEKTYGGISACLTVFSRKMVQLCKRTECSLIGINQLRDDMNNPYNMNKTPGGRAWKFFCSVRMVFKKGSPINEKGEEQKQSYDSPFGNQVNVAIIKTKSFKPDRKVGYYTLKYYEGIARTLDLVDIAIKEGIIKQAGAWFSFMDIESGEAIENDDGPIKAQGKLNAVAMLESNSALMAFVEEAVNKTMIKG